jgi:hypothetical protein
MTWTAPKPDYANPPRVSDERTSYDAWLDFHRGTLLAKCAGLTGEQLCLRSVPPSTLSLLGLVRHMTEVERWWFRTCVAGEDVGEIYSSQNDDDFDKTDPAEAEANIAAFLAECDAARAAVAGRGLDDTFRHPRRDGEIDVRWVYVHMIEEYARHNGHADLLRESIDGATGD